jgi:O-antigen ligase
MDQSTILSMDIEREQTVRNTFQVPFLTTAPVFDVAALFILLPLWWILGIDQFVWLPVVSFALFKVMLRNHFKIYLVRTARLMIFFLFVYLISGLFIVDDYRIITFVRNFSMYLSVTCLLIVLTNTVVTKQQLMIIVSALIWVAGWAAVIGVLGILDFFRPRFVTPLAQIMPSSVKGTDYGARVIFKSIGKISWFALFGDYFRVRTFFLYATMYAAVLTILIPLEIFLFRIQKSLVSKTALIILIVLSLVNLIYTTVRGAMLGLIVGFFVFLTNRWLSRNTVATLIFLIALLLISSPLVVLLISDATAYLAPIIEVFLNARGSGSYLARVLVYRETLKSWAHRPIFGWGTQRDIIGFPLPMGSHSHYLSILYKQGIVGLFVYGLTLLSVWKTLNISSNIRSSLLIQFVNFATWSFVANCLNGLTDVMDLDAIVIHVLWTIISLSLCAQRMISNSALNVRFGV